MNKTLDNVVTSISSLVSNYADEVAKQVEHELDETANEILDYIQKNCPRGDGGLHLADTFVKTEVGSGVKKVIYISSNKKGRLVHLIELGFKHRSGRHVEARPFMRPAYNEFTPKMLEDIKAIIKGGKV